MKKLFTLVALLACVLGAKAEWVEDYKVDYSTYTGFPFYVMGYVPEWVDGVMTDLGGNYTYATLDNEDGLSSDVTVKTNAGVEYYRIPKEDGVWHQYFIADGIHTELDGAYTVKAMVRASEACSINVNMGWGWSSGEQASATVNIGTEWAEVEWEYTGIGGTSCNLVAQPNTAAMIEWKSLTVSHNQKQTRPVEWIELLTNGDAETPWTEEQKNIAYDDMENNFKIAAWSKEKGHNLDENGAWNPFPADIEEVDGSHVFVCHGQVADTEGDASAWDNQFWIQAPRQIKPGEQVKVHFRYKASEAAKADTQIHHQKPSDYMHWDAIKEISFTTEWQEFDQVVSWPSGGDDKGWSIAFNLNKDNKNAVNFYFDDLSIAEMKLDKGFFVAASNSATGIEYDYDNAIEFNGDDAPVYVATVGTAGNQDTWVNEVMISTVRGNDAAFKASTLKPAGAITGDDEEWYDYAEGSLAKIKLPAAGVWTITLNTEYRKMNFEKIEGEQNKEPLDVKPNPTVIVINATERDDLADTDTEVREEEGGEGQPWDNQFWIAANRDLSGGEETVIEFDYVATKDAKTTTQDHKMGDDGKPCTYLFWNSIGDVNFTTEEQHFSKEFTIPADANGMRSIVFNLSEIKDANDYTIKNVVWKLKDNTESLIDMEGAANFWVKIDKSAPYLYGTDPSGINSVAKQSAAPAAIYNLSGQRVGADYKGIVVKNGKKYVVK